MSNCVCQIIFSLLVNGLRIAIVLGDVPVTSIAPYAVHVGVDSAVIVSDNAVVFVNHGVIHAFLTICKDVGELRIGEEKIQNAHCFFRILCILGDEKQNAGVYVGGHVGRAEIQLNNLRTKDTLFACSGSRCAHADVGSCSSGLKEFVAALCGGSCVFGNVAVQIPFPHPVEIFFVLISCVEVLYGSVIQRINENAAGLAGNTQVIIVLYIEEIGFCAVSGNAQRSVVRAFLCDLSQQAVQIIIVQISVSIGVDGAGIQLIVNVLTHVECAAVTRASRDGRNAVQFVVVFSCAQEIFVFVLLDHILAIFLNEIVQLHKCAGIDHGKVILENGADDIAVISVCKPHVILCGLICECYRHQLYGAVDFLHRIGT